MNVPLRRLWLAVCFFACAISIASPARAQMSDADRKSAARAAYLEGVQLQDSGRYAEAVKKFEAAQKFYDAPTHLLHLAQCQAATNELVEASETYETLVRKTLPSNAPEAFVHAQQQAQAEIEPLRKRIPTLKITVKPEAQRLQNLAVTVNGAQMPNELLGIARPVDPGTYRVAASATGYGMAVPVDVAVQERESKSVELVMQAGANTPPPLPVPPPYNPQSQPPPNTTAPPPAETPNPQPTPSDGPTSLGALLGVRGGYLAPAGNVAQNAKVSEFVGPGGALGLDAIFRVARMLLVGATFEYGFLGKPDRFEANLPPGVRGDVTTSSTFIGVLVGIMPNVNRVTFVGDLGFGIRTLNRAVTVAGQKTDESVSGAEFTLGAGLSIPAGPIRIVPKLGLGLGTFGDRDSNCGSVQYSGCVPNTGTFTNSAVHATFFAGIALYYSLDFGKKPAASASR